MPATMKAASRKSPVTRQTVRAAKALTADVEDASLEIREKSPADRIEALSPAELEVVQAMVGGLSPKEVATERGTSIATVRTQLKRAKKKAAARTLNELVALVCMASMEKSLNGSKKS